MAKRFIETTIWTQNKWFRKLEVHYKTLWFYLISSCDSVGVWEEDIELCSFIIGYEYSIDSLLIVYKNKLIKINDKKYWIVDFCNFQYGTLKEENIKNKPHQSYISLLKKHKLWIDYLKTMDSLKDKDKDKDKDKVKEKKEEIIFPFNSENFIQQWDYWRNYKAKEFNFKYKTIQSEQAALKQLAKLSGNNENIAIQIIHESFANGWKGFFNLKQNAKQGDTAKRDQYFKEHDPNYHNY